jgi:hypothetical protein
MNHLKMRMIGNTILFQIKSNPVAMTDQNNIQVGKIDQSLCHAFNNDTGSEVAPHCIYADSHFRVRVKRSDIDRLCFNRDDLFAVILAAGGADAVGHHRGTAGTAISGGDTFVTVGGFALTTLHTGSFSFRNCHFFNSLFYNNTVLIPQKTIFNLYNIAHFIKFASRQQLFRRKNLLLI